MKPNLQDQVKHLEAHADRLRSLLIYAPRAFVIEFAGTPKSGKSTSSEAIRHFLARHGFRVHVLTERAAVCPIPMKGHLFFNIWCAASMLAELLANVETETDIIIVDRGLFDALVWMTLQKKRGELTVEEERTIKDFLILERWRSLIDLTVVMSVSGGVAISRENSQRITRKLGSIMRPDVLEAINDSVKEAIHRDASHFPMLLHHETTGHQVRHSNIDLAEKVLNCLECFVNPKVLVVPRPKIEALPLQDGVALGKKFTRKALRCISTYGKFMRREEAEKRPGYVQIIPCGLLTRDDKVFLFQRKETDPKYRLYGKATIWQGCHVSERKGEKIPEGLKSVLQERISRSLFLSRVFPVEALGYCWDRDDPLSSQHFGLIHRIHIDNPHTAIDLKKKEFRKRRGHGLIGTFESIPDIRKNLEKLQLESWSRSIIMSLRELK